MRRGTPPTDSKTFLGAWQTRSAFSPGKDLGDPDVRVGEREHGVAHAHLDAAHAEVRLAEVGLGLAGLPDLVEVVARVRVPELLAQRADVLAHR